MSSPVKAGCMLIMNNRNIPLPGVMCLLITTIMLIAGLWPFNFKPANKVSWLQNENGIRFFGRGIVIGPELLKMPGTSSRANALTIELLIRPNKAGSANLASMLTLYDRDQEQFIFAQWKNNFNIRIPSNKGDISRPRYMGIRNVFKDESPYLITVTSGKQRTVIYIDGHPVQAVSQYVLIPEDRRVSGRLVLGNSPNGRNPWNGSFIGLAIYDRVLSSKEALDHYRSWQKDGRPRFSDKDKPVVLNLFDEHNGDIIQDYSGVGNHLLMPSIFAPLHRAVLEGPLRARWFSAGNIADMAVNILGFVPFGFFLSAWLLQVTNFPAQRVYVLVILIGFCASLAIELTQIYLPSRDSSLLDLIDNTLGTIAGVSVFRYSVSALQKEAK